MIRRTRRGSRDVVNRCKTHSGMLPRVPDAGSVGCRQPLGCGRNGPEQMAGWATWAMASVRAQSARTRHRPRKGSRKGRRNMVFVLDKRKKPLMPCSEKRARLLLKRGRAGIHVGPVAVRACGSFRVGKADGMRVEILSPASAGRWIMGIRKEGAAPPPQA